MKALSFLPLREHLQWRDECCSEDCASRARFGLQTADGPGRSSRRTSPPDDACVRAISLIAALISPSSSRRTGKARHEVLVESSQSKILNLSDAPMEPDPVARTPAAPGSPRTPEPRAKCFRFVALAKLAQAAASWPMPQTHLRPLPDITQDRVCLASTRSLSPCCSAFAMTSSMAGVSAGDIHLDRLSIVRGIRIAGELRWKPESALYAGIGSQHGFERWRGA